MGKEWTDQQRRCIEARGGTMLVSAAAGSGKTAVLVGRVMSLLTDPIRPLDITDMLIVTFTKAAATEMRSRLNAEIQASLAKHPGDRHLIRQQILLSGAPIGTVDGFCAKTLREQSHAAGISPRFRVAEDASLRLIQAETANEVIEREYQKRDPSFLALCDLISEDRSDRLLTQQLLRLHNFVQAHPFPERWLAKQQEMFERERPFLQTEWGQTLWRRGEELLSAAEASLGEAISLCDRDDRLKDAYAPSLRESLDALTSALSHGGSWDERVSLIDSIPFGRFSALRGAEDILPLKEQVTALRKQARAFVEEAGCSVHGTEQQAYRDIRESAPIARALFDLEREFESAFNAVKDEQDLLDFNDLEHRLLSLLVTPNKDGSTTRTDLAREIGSQYRAILVDEYQDTNLAQDALFSALSQDEQNLFFVGDIKQSIYGFRQAMPEIFRKRRKASVPYDGEHFPASVTLSHNFRSRKQVTGAVNALFEKLMREDFGGVNYEQNEALISSRPFPREDDPAFTAELLLIEREGKSALTAAQQEARVIGERILGMMAHGFSVTEGDAMRPAGYGDFCVLLRSASERAPVYVKEWQRMGIPVDCDSSGNLFDCAEIRLALSVLRTIDNPLLDIPLLATMFSPLYGFSPDDLAEIRKASPDIPLYKAVRRFSRSESDLAGRCRAFLDLFDRYRLLACVLPVDKLMRRIYEDTGILPIMGARSGGAARMANLRKLYDLARRFEQEDCRGLSEFVSYIDRLEAQGLSMPTAAGVPQRDAVHLMTIHHSKGLEFPVVLVAGLGNPFNNRSSTGDLLLHERTGVGMIRRDRLAGTQSETVHHRALQCAITRSEREEELRVLYVALTRAKDKLILSAVTDPLPKCLSRIAGSRGADGKPLIGWMLHARYPIDWVMCALSCFPGFNAACSGSSEEERAFPFVITRCRAADPAEERPRAQEPDAVLPADFLERLHYIYPHMALANVPIKLTASSVSHRRFTPRGHLQGPGAMSPDGLTPAQRGTAVHLFLQYADLSDGLSAEEEASALRERKVLTERQQKGLPYEALNVFLRSDLCARMVKSPHLWREHPFSVIRPVTLLTGDTPLPPGDEREMLMVQGIADGVFEEEGSLVIVDYKTDRVHSGRELVERYREQLLLYADALRETMGMPVKECMIYSLHLRTLFPVPLPKEGQST